MKDYIAIGVTPYDEECAQVGRSDYGARTSAEISEFKRMMEAIHPPLDPSMGYVVKSFQHDFGMYRELCAVFDNENDDAAQWAYDAEELTPDVWDDQAVVNLVRKGYLSEERLKGVSSDVAPRIPDDADWWVKNE